MPICKSCSSGALRAPLSPTALKNFLRAFLWSLEHITTDLQDNQDHHYHCTIGVTVITEEFLVMGSPGEQPATLHPSSPIFHLNTSIQSTMLKYQTQVYVILVYVIKIDKQAGMSHLPDWLDVCGPHLLFALLVTEPEVPPLSTYCTVIECQWSEPAYGL